MFARGGAEITKLLATTLPPQPPNATTATGNLLLNSLSGWNPRVNHMSVSLELALTLAGLGMCNQDAIKSAPAAYEKCVARVADPKTVYLAPPERAPEGPK
jgi:hypothetical protein